MSETPNILKAYAEAKQKLEETKTAIDNFASLVNALQKQSEAYAESLQMPSLPNLNKEEFEAFWKQPYLLMPRRENTWYVVVPRFVDMQLGWLEYQTPCYDSKTRVLTKNGFKFFKDATYEDEIFTLNKPLNRMEYQKPTLIHCYDYKGQMVNFNGESINLLVTPKHGVLVAGVHTKTSMRAFHLVDAQKLLDKKDYTYSMLRAGKIWRGCFKDSNGIHFHRGNPKTVSIHKVRDKSNAKCLRNVARFSLDSFASLLGWFLAEGNPYKSCSPSAGYTQYRVDIANTSDSNLSEIASLVKAIGFAPVMCNGRSKRVSFSSKQFFFFLLQFGKSHDKFIPECLKNLPQSYLRLLFNTMMKGDGGQRGDVYNTVSRKLAEDVAEVGLKLGYGVSITFLPDEGTQGIYHVNFTRKKKTPRLRRPTLEDYDGKVYCVTVPNHIILVERDGKTCWSGNSFNVFVINRYVRWLSSLPAEIEKRLGMQPTAQIKVVDGLLKPPAGMEEETWQRYRKYLYRKDPLGFRIKQGYERYVISDLIRDGYLPFTPQPVDPDDLNPIPDFVMEGHQKEAYDAFLKWGAIGIYWAGGQGKTYFASALCAMIKGPKLVVVPNITEKEQWLVYLGKFGAQDVDLLTYQAFHKAQKEYMLVVFDECHRLPAPVWSRFATLNTKYRLGLSATPYREDGREDLIIALTGYPVGMSWEQFMKTKAVRKPKITVKVVNNEREKTLVLEDMLKVPMKTLIFVELIASGEKIKNQFNIPFVWHETKDRLDIINKNLVTVVSRVGDEGISVKDLERTIEVEFLGKSRRQEAQRAYRLLHSVKPEISHTVIMTVGELDQFGKRFLALEEKGFQVEYVS